MGPTTSVLAVQLPIRCRCFVSPMISLSVIDYVPQHYNYALNSKTKTDWGWFPDARSSKFALICSHEKCPLPNCWPMLESHRKHQVILISRASWRFSPQIRSAASMTPRDLDLKIGDLQDPTDGDLRIFVPYVWRHICCSYLQLRRWWIGPYMFLAIYVVDVCSYIQLRSGPYWTSFPIPRESGPSTERPKEMPCWWLWVDGRLVIIPWGKENPSSLLGVSQVESWPHYTLWWTNIAMENHHF